MLLNSRANVAHGCDVSVVHTLCSAVRRGARAAVPARGQQHQDLLRPVHPHHARVGSGGRGQRGREKRIMTPPLQPATPISTNFFGVIFGLPLGAGGWNRAGPMRNRGRDKLIAWRCACSVRIHVHGAVRVLVGAFRLVGEVPLV